MRSDGWKIRNMFLSFQGAARAVTGANHLLETAQAKILVDCGLAQGQRFAHEKNRQPWAYDPKTIAAVILTHAHADHVGRLPKLVHDGFRGKIFATPPTLELTTLNLEDSARLIAQEAEEHREPPLFTADDVARTLTLFQPLPYHEPREIAPGVTVTLQDAGHILGSSIVVVDAEGQRIVFTGDLGNPPTPLLRETERVEHADYLVIESAYGDRVHEDRAERKKILEQVIEDTIAAGGVLMIPSFAIERTQELLFEMNELVEHRRIPRVPVFIDSPFAIAATAIYKKYSSYYNAGATALIRSGDDLFHFPGLTMTKTKDESKKINDIPAPKIIIAGSGNSEGGRILHHERRYLSDPKSTLLIIGYQVKGSLGRRLLEGERRVTIHDTLVNVRARIEQIGGYSAHADADGLYRFVEQIERPIKKIFAVQGEEEPALALVYRIRDHLGIPAHAPVDGERFELV